jgi:hypothetical protein
MRAVDLLFGDPLRHPRRAADPVHPAGVRVGLVAVHVQDARPAASCLRHQHLGRCAHHPCRFLGRHRLAVVW